MRCSLKEIIYFICNRLPIYLYGRYIGRNLVRVHWGRGLNNFGDCLQPDTLKHYGLTPYYVSSLGKADIILAGSILQLVPSDFSGYIVGTGGDCMSYKFPNAKIIGVRGKLTKSNIKEPVNTQEIVLGDAGLLMSLIYPENVIKKYELGIIFHFVDESGDCAKLYKDRFRNLNVKFINVCQHPNIVIKEIKQCKAIISSSLHGLIIADAFQIPNVRIVDRKTMPTAFYDYKFNDYYSSLNIKSAVVEIDGWENLEDLLSNTTLKPKEKIDKLVLSLDKSMKDISAKFKK